MGVEGKNETNHGRTKKNCLVHFESQFSDAHSSLVHIPDPSLARLPCERNSRMITQSLSTSDAESPRAIARRFAAVAGLFWTGRDGRRAWLVTFGLIGALLCVLCVNVGINRWNSYLFNGLEARDAAQVYHALWLIPLLTLCGAAAGVAVVYTRETMQVLWREAIVEAIVDRWIAADRYHHIQVLGVEPPNPEYRIADDTRMAVEPLVDLGIGFFSSLLAAATFIGILWSVGGATTVHLGETAYRVPAFMVLAAIAYGTVLTLCILCFGRRLVKGVSRRNEAEARLRFELTRVREHAAAVARADGGPAARGAIAVIYRDVVARWRDVIAIHMRLTWFTNGHGVLAPVFAVALATPKYLAEELTLGDVVSLGAAFVQVQAAFSWIVDNFRQIALCSASVSRIVELADATAEVPAAPDAPVLAEQSAA